ncbi:MAG: zinc ribbon domain-containing protein [Tractidigestivibacter sp.]|uniref:zinc ribbon domain-containing protein n=1 Tax=Tractidigestivibacter sp. TaxID=2847320 RepID=UPI003D8A9DB8
MKCPNCGASVPEGALCCPVCHYEFGLTQKIPVASAQWCPTCGALVEPGAEVCPKCGSPLKVKQPDPPISKRMRHMKDLPMVEDGDDDQEDTSDTQVIPRIESAIPSESGQDAATVRHDRMPRTRMLLFAGGVALAVALCLALLITHPWNPNLYQTHATEDADTSMSGYPGKLDSLTGQDSSAATTEAEVQADETTDSAYEAISSAYESLGEYATQIDESFSQFESVGYTGTLQEREDGQATAYQTATDLSNLISQINELSDGDGVYTDDIANLQTLGNWLRNRSDAICAAWDEAVERGDSTSSSSSVPTSLQRIGYSDGTDSYKTLFDENYENWKPTQKSQ